MLPEYYCQSDNVFVIETSVTKAISEAYQKIFQSKTWYSGHIVIWWNNKLLLILIYFYANLINMKYLFTGWVHPHVQIGIKRVMDTNHQLATYIRNIQLYLYLKLKIINVIFIFIKILNFKKCLLEIHQMMSGKIWVIFKNFQESNYLGWKIRLPCKNYLNYVFHNALSRME